MKTLEQKIEEIEKVLGDNSLDVIETLQLAKNIIAKRAKDALDQSLEYYKKYLQETNPTLAEANGSHCDEMLKENDRLQKIEIGLKRILNDYKP